jgi:hypothetical protein
MKYNKREQENLKRCLQQLTGFSMTQLPRFFALLTGNGWILKKDGG